MKNSNHIEPKNLTAQLHYRGIGNPPTSHPSSAISNSFPGLEADFRNIWIHFFEGIILHEASNLVVGIEDPANNNLQRLLEAPYFLVRAHGKPMTAPVKGPSAEFQNLHQRQYAAGMVQCPRRYHSHGRKES